MSELSNMQRKFTFMVAQLIQFAYNNGYALTFGCARCANLWHHKDNSNHYRALAIDLNLFVMGPDGQWRYTGKTEDHAQLGQFWENIGGTWGGRFNDGNHYSLEYKGMK